MFDFKLDNNGDIGFEETLQANKFRVRFCMAENNMALMRFMTQVDSVQDNSDKFCLSFKTDLEENGQQRILSTLDNETLTQYIWIALKTELGEIEQRPELGSSLVELTYDRPITSEKLAAIQKTVETQKRIKAATERYIKIEQDIMIKAAEAQQLCYRDWETDRKSTRLNSSHSAKSRMPSSA